MFVGDSTLPDAAPARTPFRFDPHPTRVPSVARTIVWFPAAWMVAATFPLEQLREAQRVFMDKRFVGKIVLDHARG